MNNIVGLSKIGLVRKQNEDRFFISDNICAVTDGMGGYRGGEIASTYAVDEIKEYLQSISTIDELSLQNRTQKVALSSAKSAPPASINNHKK